MRATINQFGSSFVIVNPNSGFATEAFYLWMQQVVTNGLLIGIGTPEGVVEAVQGVEYMDETGATGAVKYIKQLTDIIGDRTKGWVAIG